MHARSNDRRGVFLCLLYLLCLLCLLCLSSFASSEQATQRPQPKAMDAAEIARDLIYHPALSVESVEGTVVFRARQFTYRLDLTSEQWQVAREDNSSALLPQRLTRYTNARLNTEFRFTGDITDEEGVLTIQASGESEPIRLILWNRQRLADAWLDKLQQESPGLSAEELVREIEPAEPEVAAVADDGQFLWLAIRHYAGEGWLGLGSVVRFNSQTHQAEVFQPRELATSSVTHIAASGGVLWLGTHRQGEGYVEATAGLVRFDPNSGETKSYQAPASKPMTGHIVTGLAAADSTIWAATDEGFCRIAGEAWNCWRIVPTVHTARPLPVSDYAGARPTRQLAPGSYELRWANVGFLEVVTPNSTEGWVEMDDLEDYRSRTFDTPAFELDNTRSGGAAVMRLLRTPEGNPLEAAQVYRAALEPVGPPENGWQRVRARVGWVTRVGLEVVPVITSAGSP